MTKTKYNTSWILANWEDYMNWAELCKAYNKEFGTDVTYDTFKAYCNTALRLRVRETDKNDYDDSWILTNWEDYRNWKSLCIAYNALFGTDIGYNTFKSHCNRELGLTFVYSKEEEDWLRQNYPKLGRIKCAAEFNKVFDTNRTANGIAAKCKKMKLVVSDDRRKRLAIENTGRYHEPGTILDKGRGYLFIKRSDGRWVQLQRYVAGADDLSPDTVVIFLDGNKRNLDPENLMAIPRSYLGPMSKNGFWSEFPEVTKTGLIWCELKDVLQKCSRDTGGNVYESKL